MALLALGLLSLSSRDSWFHSSQEYCLCGSMLVKRLFDVAYSEACYFQESKQVLAGPSRELPYWLICVRTETTTFGDSYRWMRADEWSGITKRWHNFLCFPHLVPGPRDRGGLWRCKRSLASHSLRPLFLKNWTMCAPSLWTFYNIGGFSKHKISIAVIGTCQIPTNDLVANKEALYHFDFENWVIQSDIHSFLSRLSTH